MATDFGLQVELLGLSMGDQSAYLSEAHGRLEELPNASATRNDSVDLIKLMINRLGGLVDGVITGATGDQQFIQSNSGALKDIETEYVGTRGEVEARLDGTKNDTAKEGLNFTLATGTHIADSIAALGEADQEATETITALKGLRRAIDSLSQSAEIAQENITNMGVSGAKAEEAVRLAAGKSEGAHNKLLEYSKSR